MPSRLNIFASPEHAVLSLEVQAAMGPKEQARKSQFQLLVRHFLERFFNQMTSEDGEAKTRLIQVACATGLPGLVVAMYLWVPYHDMFGRPRPYWAQVSDHYFYVVYSFVAMGIITVFEWDLFFPDLLDVFVLASLPIKNRTLFLARIAAVCIFIIGFLFDSNFLAALILPAAIDPPSLTRFLVGHLLAVTASSIFAASLVLALQGVILSILGERFFRKIALILQGLLITALLMLLFLLPIQSQALAICMHSNSALALYFPPFWFLGIYQRLMEGPAALPIYTRLAQIGCWATLVTMALAAVSYPLAYWRRIRQSMEGISARDTRSWSARPINRILHATVLRVPVRRAVYHFIHQTLPRVQRYRIYLVMYGGLGLSLVAATILRLDVQQRHLRIEISTDGLRAAIPMVAFWTIAGMRMAFVSPGDHRGSWIFRTIHGKPGLDQLAATKLFVFLWGTIVTVGMFVALHGTLPTELRGWRTTVGELFVAVGLCLLLTDIFFLNVKIIPFTAAPAPVKNNLAIVLLKYFAFFPPLVLIVLNIGPWIEASAGHIFAAALVVAAIHSAMQAIHRRIVREHINLPDIDEDQEEFPMKLGLRY